MNRSTNLQDEPERSSNPEDRMGNMMRGEGDPFDSSPPTNRRNNYQALLSGRKSKPKLVSAQAVLSSRLESESIQEESVKPLENVTRTPENQEPGAVLEHSETKTDDGRKSTNKERGNEAVKERNIAEKGSLTESREVSRKNTWRVGQRERWRGKRRERLGGSVENLAEENEAVDRETNCGIRWKHTQKHWGSKERQDEESEKEDGSGSMERDTEAKGAMSRHVFSRVLAHSFASSSSSSSSSFNCSSAESDEVFSEGEEMAKRKDVRRVSITEQGLESITHSNSTHLN